jgi:hypothetical protein
MEALTKEEIHNLGAKEGNVFTRFYTSIRDNANTESEKDMAIDCINYIIRQLNEDSLRGTINFFEYQNMVENAVDGLFLLVYIQYYNEDLVVRDTVFASSLNFLFFLFSRVYNGRDRDILIKQIESQRPVVIQGAGGH